LNDGTPISRYMIYAQVKKFVFHNYRNTALIESARRGIPVDVALKASGHSSVQMHQRYVESPGNVGRLGIGTAADSQIGTQIDTQNRRASRN
jgi:integrase